MNTWACLLYRAVAKLHELAPYFASAYIELY
jgi:hypothetical protein